MAFRIGRALRRPKIFDRVYKRAVSEAESEAFDNFLAMKVNGDFAKWFIT